MYIVAVDPGREKCGVAVLRRDGTVLDHRVVPAAEIFSQLRAYESRYGAFDLIVGDRTGAKQFLAEVERQELTDRIGRVVQIDEHLSTLEARTRYFIENPPKGIRRLIPRTLQTPPEPYDDYVAIILAERFIRKEEGS